MTAALTSARVGEAKSEVRILSSSHKNGSPMFPGRQLFIWVRPPHFPWILAGIEPHDEGHAA